MRKTCLLPRCSLPDNLHKQRVSLSLLPLPNWRIFVLRRRKVCCGISSERNRQKSNRLPYIYTNSACSRCGSGRSMPVTKLMIGARSHTIQYKKLEHADLEWIHSPAFASAGTCDGALELILPLYMCTRVRCFLECKLKATQHRGACLARGWT